MPLDSSVAGSVASFATLALFGVPFPLVVTAAAEVGWLLGRLAPHTLTSQGKRGHDASSDSVLKAVDGAVHH